MERFGISVSGQLLELVRFSGVGVLLGVWYDLFRLIRLLTRPSARRVFLQDLLFFAGSAAITLLLSLPISSGRVRFFHLLALVLGFFCYYQTVGRLIYVTARWLVRLLDRLAAWGERVSRRFSSVCRRRLFRCRQRIRERTEARKAKKVAKPAKKAQKNLKNRLKLSRKV